MLLLVLQLIFFMFLLIAVGKAFRAVFLRSLKLFSDLDFIQICILDVYLGGFVLYIIAMLPFRLFSWSVVFGFTVLSFLVSVFIHFKALRYVTRLDKIRVFLIENKKAFFDYTLVFAIFIIFLLFHFLSLSDVVLGSVFDDSIHSLKVEVILENNCAPVTLEPYLPEGNIYPLASHVIFAFAAYMLNMEVPKAVFYVTTLFKSLSVFGAYFLGKKLCSERIYYLGLSFVLAFISSWPLFVGWGGNPFLVGFPLFLVSLGLLFSLLRSHVKNNFAGPIAIGLLFGYTGAIIISYLQTLIVIAVFGFAFLLIRKRGSARSYLLKFFILFSVSLLPLSPFLYRFFIFYQYPGHNIGIPEDFSGYPAEQLHVNQAVSWAFENLYPYHLLRLITMLLLVSFGMLLWKTRDYKDIKSQLVFTLAIFLAATLLSFIAFLLPTDFGIVSWGHQGIILIIPINILIVTFYAKLFKFCRGCKLKRLAKISYSTLLLAITLVSLITAPFLYYRFLVDPRSLRGAYRMFAVTTPGDYDLMTWMKGGNVSSDAVILVSPYEAGLFIPSISNHKIVFPYSGCSFSRSYQNLVNLLLNNVLNETTYKLMLNYSISHVFIGSDAAYWWFERHKWNPAVFLGNPNFKLVKNVGGAYLFELNYMDPNIVFRDDFEHVLWNENGWRTYFVGTGLGNVTITTSFGCNGSKCLRMRSQMIPTISESKHAYCVSREIFFQNNSDITFSFYLNATEGFDGEDTFAVLISNTYRNQSMVITTPNGFYDGYAYAKTLDESEGLFSFDLSMFWHQTFNSSLPNTFILELVNYDFDGVENVAYIDDIKISSKPIA